MSGMSRMLRVFKRQQVCAGSRRNGSGWMFSRRTASWQSSSIRTRSVELVVRRPVWPSNSGYRVSGLTVAAGLVWLAHGAVHTEDATYQLQLSPEEIKKLLAQYEFTRNVETGLVAASAAVWVGLDVMMLTGTGLFGVLVFGGMGSIYICSNLATVNDGAGDELSLAHKGRLRFLDAPPEMLLLLGLSEFHTIMNDSKVRILKDRPNLTKRCQRVGQRVADASKMVLPAGQKWEFFVIDDNEKNAFVLPGGKVFVHRGLMELLNKDGELEVVLCHEIAHVQAQHARERVSLARFPTLLRGTFILLSLFGMNLILDPSIWQIDLASNLFFTLPFSRTHEDEADTIGLDNLIRANIRPDIAISTWSKMEKSHSHSSLPSFLSTHPCTQSRLASMESLMPKKMEAFRHYHRLAQ